LWSYDCPSVRHIGRTLGPTRERYKFVEIGAIQSLDPVHVQAVRVLLTTIQFAYGAGCANVYKLDAKDYAVES
jgi:hypothetical protein